MQQRVEVAGLFGSHVALVEELLRPVVTLLHGLGGVFLVHQMVHRRLQMWESFKEFRVFLEFPLNKFLLASLLVQASLKGSAFISIVAAERPLENFRQH